MGVPDSAALTGCVNKQSSKTEQNPLSKGNGRPEIFHLEHQSPEDRPTQ